MEAQSVPQTSKIGLQGPFYSLIEGSGLGGSTRGRAGARRANPGPHPHAVEDLPRARRKSWMAARATLGIVVGRAVEMAANFFGACAQAYVVGASREQLNPGPRSAGVELEPGAPVGQLIVVVDHLYGSSCVVLEGREPCFGPERG